MSSPPFSLDDGAIDLAHLRRMTLGDPRLEREVLVMFNTQSAGLLAALAGWPPEAAALTHTLKGSARALGAFRLAEAAELLETVMMQGGDVAEALGALTDAVAQARSAIDDILHRPSFGGCP